VIADIPAGSVAVGVPARVRTQSRALPDPVDVDDPAIYI
jgi:serine O-acetyltransferase